MDQQSPSDLLFTVRRSQPELVTPAKPTPRELKLLSDIDDQESLRFQIRLIHIYRYEPSMAGKDPAQVIRHALAQTLVFYYPFAGRLREGPGRKLMVDCTAEGVLFIEADADVTLDQFGDTLQPPFPCFDELLYNVPGSEGIIHCPLLLMQVTRLKCGGFILGFRLNHTMCDGPGLIQFMNALAEIARGATEPTIPPLWRRELLKARDPPRITCTHREYEQVPNSGGTEEADIAQGSVFIANSKIAAIRRQLVPHRLREYCSTFEILTACLWRCRTIALQLEAEEEVRLMCICNTRGRKFNPPLVPVGYYGNAFVFPASVTTAGKLCGNPLEYAVELVKKVKAEATEEYVHSAADLMVIRGRPLLTTVTSYLVSDLSHARFKDMDFGWGKAVYGGIAEGGIGAFPGVSFLIAHENAKGEEGIVVPICLPPKALKRFEKALDDMLKNHSIIKSSL